MTPPVQKRNLLYEGKAKRLYATDQPDTLIQEFKDEATAFNAQKRGVIPKKGIYSNQISAQLFRVLEEAGIPTHFLDVLSDREMWIRHLEMIPLEVVVRNWIAGSLARRLGLEEGQPLDEPVVEFYYKSDPLGDPLVTEDHIRILGVATPEEVAHLRDRALDINRILTSYLEGRELLLVDFKLEFGRHRGEIFLGDEIGPDTCRFWDAKTRNRLDKDRFRLDLGGVEGAYEEVYRRICEAPGRVS